MRKLVMFENTIPFKILNELVFDVYAISGETNKGEKKQIIYITSVGTTKYFVEKLCGKDATITKIKRIFVWELKKFSKKHDAVIIDIHRLFARFFDDGFIIPPFVRQFLDIDRPIREIFRLKSGELRKISRYSYEISHDYDALKYFYEKMCVSHANKKYANLVHVDDFHILENYLKNGELIFIKLNGKCISGMLSDIIGDTYHCRRNGVIDESYVREGALLATYYFSILRAKDIGMRKVGFGQSRPFLSDGVLRHKSLWGSKIVEDQTLKRVIYLKNIFEQPFIYIEDEKLKGAIFSEDDKLLKEYSTSGLEFTVVNMI